MRSADMSQPFDGDGPTLKESLKKFREFATSPKATYLRKALEKASELYFNVKQKPNPVGAVSSLLGLVEYGAEVLTPIPQKTKKSMSKAQSAFQKIFDEGWLLLEIETAEVVLPLLDVE